MKNNLTQYLEIYQNSASRKCLKTVLKSKTEKEYIDRIQKQINLKIKEITEIKQSIYAIDQMISFIYFNQDAQALDGFKGIFDFYLDESNKLCKELHVKIENLHDYVDILAIAKANLDMNNALIDNELILINQYGDDKK